MDSPRTLLQARLPVGAGARVPAAAPGGIRAARRAGDATPSSAEELLLARYRLCEELGAGGFGVVWRAHDELLRREVAVKRIPLTPSGERERANREALAAARLSHPAIVALYEACASDDALYLITELVHGQTLARLIAGRELDDALVLAVGSELCGALAHAHSRGVIHRDVKPGNVIVPYAFLDATAGSAAKLTDFGGAWMSGAGALTRTGDVLGTLAYMAPEQAEGRDAEEAADLYSLALVLYEALSGRNPVRGATPAETARRIGKPVPSLARARGDLPRGLIDALDRALLARPRSRGTLPELAHALAHAHDQTAPRPVREAGPYDDAAPTARERGKRGHTPTMLRAVRPRLAGAAPRPRNGFFDDVAWSENGPADARSAAMGHPRPRVREAPARSPTTAETPTPVPAFRRAAHADSADSARQQSPGRRRGLPRALWLGCAAAAIIWQAATGRPGIALLLLAACIPLVAIPRHSAGAWLLAGLAPVLGLTGLAGAFPAIAGQLRSWQLRAALGALGYWWLTLAQPLAHTQLWLAAPRALPPRHVWESSLSHAVHVLSPMLNVGVLLGAGAWAAGALVLPLLARGRSALADAVAVAAWSVALVLAARLLDGPLPAGATHASPRGAVIGALFGAAIALGARALRGPV